MDAVRTYRHPDRRIARLDGRKFDLVVLFRKAALAHPVVFVLQVKSTKKTYRHFCRSPHRRNIKCILVTPRESLPFVMADLKVIFKSALSIDYRHNKFLRPKLLKLFR